MFFRISVIILIILNCIYVNADVNNYIIGLKAYRDGFIDIAKDNLKEYVKQADSKEKKSFASYILATIYFKEKDFQKTLLFLDGIETRNDPRINISQVREMKMFALTNVNCDLSLDFLKKYPLYEFTNIYINSNCEKNDKLFNIICDNLTDENKLQVLYNLLNSKLYNRVFNCIDLSKVKKEDLREIGLYFFKNKEYNKFWKVFGFYKDDDFVNLALSRYWQKEDYDKFINNFNAFLNNFHIESENYCRAIKIYNDKGLTYDCSLIDKCIDNKRLLNKNKIACFIKNKNINKLSEFINEENGKYLCDYGGYLIKESLYNHKILRYLSNCKDRRKYVGFLYENKKFNDLIIFLGDPSSDFDYFFLALSYKKLGNKEKSSIFSDKLKSIELKKYLDNY
ncbi:MAG: hypothetical protein SVN78_08625 [Deferribacterota bacterium]|nr:hypothetical protein [Deferribacterota bacterium]